MNWHVFAGVLGGGFALAALLGFAWAMDDSDALVFRLIIPVAFVVACAACFGLALPA